jgi:hypothetical protein
MHKPRPLSPRCAVSTEIENGLTGRIDQTCHGLCQPRSRRVWVFDAPWYVQPITFMRKFNTQKQQLITNCHFVHIV